MNSVVAPLAERPAWSALSAHQKATGALDLRTLFVDDPARGKRLALALPSIPAGRARRIRAVLLAGAAAVRGLPPSSVT
jgi:hypothetical protein